MIRKLIEEDRTKVLEYLAQDPSLNIFIIGDIENFGFDADFQTTYGEFDENDEYLSVLLFYRDNLVYYSHLDHFNEAYVPFMKKHEVNNANAALHLAKLIHPYLPNYSFKEMYFAEARGFDAYESYDTLDIKTLRNEEDSSRLYDMLCSIDEFGIDKTTRESFIEGKMNSLDSGVVLFIEDDAIITSTVATVAETKQSAMVVAVGTRKEHRGNGYASKLMTALMDMYFDKKKYLCLFYDNPKAGKIYQRLGFKNIDKWVMMGKERD